MMANTVFISRTSHRPATTPTARLDAILSSVEEALARAEAHLRRAQQAHVRSVPSLPFDVTVLKQYPHEIDQQ